MKKNGIYVALCLVLMLTLLTGCGGNNANKDNNTTNTDMTGDKAPDTNSGIVTDTDGIIDDHNDTSHRNDVPVTDDIMTDANNGLHDAGNAVGDVGNAVGNAVEGTGRAIERGVNDMTGRNR